MFRRFMLHILCGKLICFKDAIAFYIPKQDIEVKESLYCDVDLMISKIRYLQEVYKND